MFGQLIHHVQNVKNPKSSPFLKTYFCTVIEAAMVFR